METEDIKVGIEIKIKKGFEHKFDPYVGNIIGKKLTIFSVGENWFKVVYQTNNPADRIEFDLNKWAITFLELC